MSELVRVLSSKKAPEAIGPYSQGVIAGGDMVFLSGSIPLDAESKKLVEGSIGTQTKQVFKNMKAILQSHGLTLDNVVKTTVFLTDLKDFEEMNKVYAEAFNPPFPARSTVQVSALPKGARIEIEAIAVVHHT